MKIYTKFISLFVLAAGLSACQNDELEAVTSDSTLEFYTSSQIHTRTELQNGKTVLWQDGDQIAVYDFSAPKHTFKAIVSEGKAQFKGNITPRCGTFIAAYPNELASENNVGQNILMRLPNEQTAVKDGFAQNANLSVAKGERNVDGSPSQVTFYNICQLFKFNIPTYTANRIASIQLSTTSGIAGELTVGFEDHNPTISLGSGASNTITLLPPTGTTSFAEGTYYFVVAPVEVKGFTLTLTDTNGKQYTQHSSNTFGGVWNVIYNLGNLDLIDKPVITANHYYDGTTLKGTNLSLTTPTHDKAWSAVVKNAQGETVRTMATGNGTLTSDYTDATWPYLPVGTYTVDYTYTTANKKQMNATTTFQITERPQFTVTFNAASPHTYYSGDEVAKDVAKANSMDKYQVTALSLTINGIDPALLNNQNYSYSVSNSFDGTASGSAENITTFNDLTISQLGETTLSASATFDGVTQSDDKKVWITGLPFLHEPVSLGIWSKSGDVTDEGDHLLFGKWSSGDQTITYNGVLIPAATRMVLNYKFRCDPGTMGTSFYIMAGTQTIMEGTSKGAIGYGDEVLYEGTKIVSNNTQTSQLVCRNSYGAEASGSLLYRVGLSYSE